MQRCISETRGLAPARHGFSSYIVKCTAFVDQFLVFSLQYIPLEDYRPSSVKCLFHTCSLSHHRTASLCTSRCYISVCLSCAVKRLNISSDIHHLIVSLFFTFLIFYAPMKIRLGHPLRRPEMQVGTKLWFSADKSPYLGNKTRFVKRFEEAVYDLSNRMILTTLR